jgi:hypothetical protein
MRFWKGRGVDRLAEELRTSRPQPRKEFVHMLAKQVSRQHRPRVASARVAFAGALTLVMLVAMAAFGGVGYAASSVKNPVFKVAKIAKKAVAPQDKLVRRVATRSPAANQYKFVVCHRPPGNPSNGHTLEVGSQAAVDAHVRNHPGDHPGPC